MSLLTIEFQQMFLLVNYTYGANVLLPAQGHAATLMSSLFVEPMQLKGANLLIQKDGLDLVKTTVLRPGAKYLPFLDYLFGMPVRPLPETSAADIPDTLNARVYLAGGSLEELPAQSPAARDIEWSFVKTGGEVVLKQSLTDRLLFTLPLDAMSKYSLAIRTGSSQQLIEIPAEGADFTLANLDVPKAHATQGMHKLVEYKYLYDLTTADTLAIDYPYPTAYIGSLGGGDQPICGGGQGDGGDDPPPPPDPPPGR